MERFQKAFDDLIYMPHLRDQERYPGFIASPSECEARGKGRYWDRGDLFHRLHTYRPSTWFCKPQALSPTECARRGWENTALDMLTCEFCRVKVSCPIPTSATFEVAELTAKRHATRREEGHEKACPWRTNICDVHLLDFPTLSSDAIFLEFKERLSCLKHATVLPPLKSPVLFDVLNEAVTSRFIKFLDKSVSSDSLLLMLGGTNAAVAETDSFDARGQIIAMCGWTLVVLNAGRTPLSPMKNGLESLPFNKVGPESAVLRCGLCGARAGLWSFFQNLEPRPLVSPTQSSRPGALTPSHGSTKNVTGNYTTTIAGGVLSQSAAAAEAAKTMPAPGPFGGKPSLPLFGAPEGSIGDRNLVTETSTPPLPSHNNSNSNNNCSSSNGDNNKRKYANDFLDTVIGADSAGKTKKAKGKEGSFASVTTLQQYKSATALDPIAGHRSFCPWIHATQQENGIGPGWLHYLRCLSEHGHNMEPEIHGTVTAPSKGGDTTKNERNRTFDSIELLRRVLRKVDGSS